MSGTRSACPKAPAIEACLGQAALLICGYGSTGGWPDLNRRARSIRCKMAFAETAGATLFGDPRLEDVVGSLSGVPILVVPLFMAKGVTHSELNRRLQRLTRSERIVLCPEVGCHPDLATRVAGHAERHLGRLGWAPEETGLVLVGHGSRRNGASRTATERLAADLANFPRFVSATAAFLEEDPRVPEAVQDVTAKHVLAVGCFTEAGRHATRDLPEQLLRSRRPTAYTGPIGAFEWIDSLILDQAMEGVRRFDARADQRA